MIIELMSRIRNLFTWIKWGAAANLLQMRLIKMGRFEGLQTCLAPG